MQQLQNALLDWVKELENHKAPDWNVLPDIDLYMDQVITYLERQMAIFSKSEEEKLITPAMINNYVKNEVIPRPVQKKYAREHLAHLLAVLNLKQVLSLSDITKLISLETSDRPTSDVLNQFNLILDESLTKTSLRVKEALNKLDGEENDEDATKRLSLLALKLSLEANASRIAAKRILDEIMINQSKTQEEKEKTKESVKEKDKSKDRKSSS